VPLPTTVPEVRIKKRRNRKRGKKGGKK